MPRIFITLLLFLSSCASITTGTTQQVTVSTEPMQGAVCMLSNNKGSWYIPNTPGSVMISKSYQDLVINCKKDDLTNVMIVKSSIKGMNAGNLIFGGPIGLAVDAGTGGGYEYPSMIHVPLFQKS